MIYEFNLNAVIVFGLIVAFTLWLSVYLGKQARSASGFFAAGGGIHWFVNGVAFAGDYLSAASFLGICGMIAFYGYDGFLYSIGYLAGWVVALFVVAEPLKRLGRYTFADALDSKFNSRGIKLTAAVSTLVVSIFYLIPQMVGAGALVKPLFGMPHWAGVSMVGAIVILIVVSAGMVSTTYVQFIKGGLLVVFSTVLVGLVLARGLKDHEPASARGGWTFQQWPAYPPGSTTTPDRRYSSLDDIVRGLNREIVPADGPWKEKPYLRLVDKDTGDVLVYRIVDPGDGTTSKLMRLNATQTVTRHPDGRTVVRVASYSPTAKQELHPIGHVSELPGSVKDTGPLRPLEYIATLSDSTVITWKSDLIVEADGTSITIYYPVETMGRDLLRPGNHPSFAELRSGTLTHQFNFVSLMLALFCGTASLPHILIRYYTVKDQASARKSTIVGIGSIGFFYVLTLYMGLGAMTSGALDVTNSNMAAPLLARSFNEWLFAIISAIAFTTVLGTVSGLIIAASGAVVHDLMSSFLGIDMHDSNKVRVAKIASVVVGGIAIVLGILFEKMNVNYLVGWAFSIAASANLPSLVMLLFWRGTTKQGIAAAIFVGMVSSLAWILLSGDTYKDVYGLAPETAIVPFSQPGIVTIPLGFATLVAVSLATRAREGGE